MKKRYSLLVLCTIICVTMLSAIVVNANDVENSTIEVLIDNEILFFDVEPEIIGGRTMVPMRTIFEHLGAYVNWSGYDQSIRASCGNLIVRMQINCNEMKVGSSVITLDTPPVIKDGRTLVPLRAVAEAFSAKVEWIGETRSVIITTPYPKNQYNYSDEFDKKHIRTSCSDLEYIDFSIEGDLLTFGGFIKDENIVEVRIFFDGANVMPYDGDTAIENEERTFKAVWDLSTVISDEHEACGDVQMIVFVKYRKDDYYTSYSTTPVEIECVGGNYVFKRPQVLDNNNEFMTKWENPIAYIKSDIDEEIAALSDEICKNAVSDYEKVLFIHDWVADSIYYDYDFYNGLSKDISYDVIWVLESKRSVCEGYANLTQALICAQGIPCRKISGYAVNDCWNEENAGTKKTNHAWNQAYVDNRWVNIDTTWASGNRYSDGEYHYEGIDSHLYFDITDVYFSFNHKYMYCE